MANDHRAPRWYDHSDEIEAARCGVTRYTMSSAVVVVSTHEGDHGRMRITTTLASWTWVRFPSPAP